MTRVVPLPRPGLWLGSAIVVVLAALVALSVFRNPNIRHDVVAQYQFAPAILRGLELTIVLALLAAAIGIVLGVLLAVMRVSSSPILRLASAGYTWLVRGTPLLVQILIWGNLALLFEHIGPFRTNDVLTPFVASVIALGLNEAAYMSDVVRAGIGHVAHAGDAPHHPAAGVARDRAAGGQSVHFAAQGHVAGVGDRGRRP